MDIKTQITQFSDTIMERLIGEFQEGLKKNPDIDAAHTKPSLYGFGHNHVDVVNDPAPKDIVDNFFGDDLSLMAVKMFLLHEFKLDISFAYFLTLESWISVMSPEEANAFKAGTFKPGPAHARANRRCALQVVIYSPEGSSMLIQEVDNDGTLGDRYVQELNQSSRYFLPSLADFAEFQANRKAGKAANDHTTH